MNEKPQRYSFEDKNFNKALQKFQENCKANLEECKSLKDNEAFKTLKTSLTEILESVDNVDKAIEKGEMIIKAVTFALYGAGLLGAASLGLIIMASCIIIAILFPPATLACVIIGSLAGGIPLLAVPVAGTLGGLMIESLLFQGKLLTQIFSEEPPPSQNVLKAQMSTFFGKIFI